MKAYLEQLLIPDDALFILKKHKLPRFETPHHYHREMELKIMLEGYGKGFIGDYVYEYQPGDMVLVGPNLPHHWESAPHFEQKGVSASCIYIQFKEDFIGSEIFDKADFLPVRKLFSMSRQGIQFHPRTTQSVLPLVEKLQNQAGPTRLITFLELISLLSSSFTYRLFLNAAFHAEVDDADHGNLRTIYRYIQKNFKNDIRLEVICNMVSMSKSTFCTYFKKRTQKTFFDFVHEVRVHHALSLIRNNGFTVAEACYASGFGNISFFNRKFKEIYGLSPRKYLKQIL